MVADAGVKSQIGRDAFDVGYCFSVKHELQSPLDVADLAFVGGEVEVSKQRGELIGSLVLVEEVAGEGDNDTLLGRGLGAVLICRFGWCAQLCTRSAFPAILRVLIRPAVM